MPLKLLHGPCAYMLPLYFDLNAFPSEPIVLGNADSNHPVPTSKLTSAVSLPEIS